MSQIRTFVFAQCCRYSGVTCTQIRHSQPHNHNLKMNARAYVRGICPVPSFSQALRAVGVSLLMSKHSAYVETLRV